MSRIRYVILFSIVLVLAFTVASVAAQGGPPGSWASGIACVNLNDSAEANIMLSFYQEGNGTAALAYADPVPIPAGGSRNYYSPTSPPGVPPGFTGSVVVSSDQPMSCNVNTQTQSTGTASDPYRIGTSAGVGDEADTPVYAPQVMKELSGWSSYIAVQNTTTSDVAVTVTYKDSAGGNVGAATEMATIPGQSNKIFYQAGNSGLPTNFIGAATVEADDGTSPLAVVVNYYNSGSSSGTSQLHSYNGMTSGANKLFVPRIVRNFYGYNGGLSIQNIGTPATIQIDFSFAGNDYQYTSGSIQSGAALPLYAPNISELGPVDALPEGQRFGSAVIEVLSGGPIVAIVNEDNRGGPGVPAERVGQGSSYNAVPDGEQTNSVFFSQITRNAGPFSGGFQIANTTGTAGTCDINYVADTGANETGVTLPANGSIARYGPSVAGLDDGYNAAVSVSCSQPVVSISNLAVNPGSGKFGDSFTQGNGLNQ